MADSNVNISVQADVDQATSALNRLGDNLNSLGKKIGNVGKSLTAMVTLPLLLLGAKAVEVGASLEAMDATFQQVFGNMTDEARKFSKELSKSVGFASGIINKTQLEFGKMGSGFGLGGEELTDFTQKFTKLTLDLASFNDLSIEDATDRMKSGLRGEADAVETLGIFMGEQQIAEQLAIMGLKKKWSALDMVTKQEVFYALAMRQTIKAQNQANRESGSYQVNLQNLNWALAELSQTLYRHVAPYITEALMRVTDLITGFSALDGRTQKIILIFAGVVGVLGPVLIVLGMLISSIGIVATAISGLGTAVAMLFSPITLIILAIAGLIAGFVYLYKTNEEFRNKANKAWQEIYSIISVIVANIMTVIRVFVAVAKELWTAHGAEILAIVSQTFDFIYSFIKIVLEGISGIVKVFKALMLGDFDLLKVGVLQAFDALAKGIELIMTSGLKLLQNIIQAGINVALDIFGRVWSGVKTLMTEPVESAVKWIKNELDYLAGLFAKFKLPSIKGSVNITTTNTENGVPVKPKTRWFAKGGVFNSASEIGVGEDGAEAVLPLTNNRTMAMLGAKISEFMPDGAGNGSGSGDIINNFVVNATIREDADVEKLGEKLYKLQQRESRRLGRSGI